MYKSPAERMIELAYGVVFMKTSMEKPTVCCAVFLMRKNDFGGWSLRMSETPLRLICATMSAPAFAGPVYLEEAMSCAINRPITNRPRRAILSASYFLCA